MDRALAVVEAKEATKELVAEAGELADGVDAELLLLHVTTEAEFHDRQNAIKNVAGLDSDYGVDSAESGAKRFAQAIGSEALDGAEYTTMGKIGDRQDVILQTAQEEGVDHIFIHGRQRSPAGKAVFGDLAQGIILNFDGPVTVRTTAEDE